MSNLILTRLAAPNWFKPNMVTETWANTQPTVTPDSTWYYVRYKAQADVSAKNYLDRGVTQLNHAPAPEQNALLPQQQEFLPDGNWFRAACGGIDPTSDQARAVDNGSTSPIQRAADAAPIVGVFGDQGDESGFHSLNPNYAIFYQRYRDRINALIASNTLTFTPVLMGGYGAVASLSPSGNDKWFENNASHVRDPLRTHDGRLPMEQYYEGNNALQWSTWTQSYHTFMDTSCCYYPPVANWNDRYMEWLNSLMIGRKARTLFAPEHRTRKILAFNWEKYDYLQGAYGLNWQSLTTEPAGKLLQLHRISDSYNTMMAVGADSAILADGAWCWDDRGAPDLQDINVQFDQSSAVFTNSAGQQTAFPFATVPGLPSFPPSPYAGADFFNLGKYLCRDYMGRVTRGAETIAFCRFKLDNGAWYETRPNGSDVLYRAKDYAGTVLVVRKGAEYYFRYFNQYGDGSRVTLTIDYDGNTITTDVVDGNVALIPNPVLATALGLDQGTTPTDPTTPATFSVSGVYNKLTHILSLSGQNATGPITWSIPYVTTGFELQPEGGFAIPALLRADNGQTVSIQAKTSSGQTAQTAIFISPDPVATPEGTASYKNLARAGIGLYPETTNPRDFGNGPEDRTKFEWYGLREIAKSDGNVLDYLPRLKAIAEAHNATDKLGGYVLNLWSHMKVGANVNSAWTRGNFAPAWERYMQNLFGYLHDNNMSMGLAFYPGRESGFREWISDYDRVRDHAQENSTFAVITPALRNFARLLPGFDVNNIPTASSAGKYLTDAKDYLRIRKPNWQNNSMSFIMLGSHDNGELGYGTFQNTPESTWGDWHPEEIADLQAYLKTLYSNNLQALCQAWFNNPNALPSWDQVTLPYTGDLNDFQGQRGFDCEKFRHQRIGDYIEIMCRVIWSELPGIVVSIQFGQPFGGQSGIIGTMDMPYFYARAQAVADELGITVPCVAAKYNPSSGEDLFFRSRYIDYAMQQSLGYCHLMMEYSYEIASDPQYLTAVFASNSFRDFYRGGITGRPDDSVTALAVLFTGNDWSKSGGVADMFHRLFTLQDRFTAPFGFNIASSEKTVTTTMTSQLLNMINYPRWNSTLAQQWEALGGRNEDVRIAIQGFGLPVAVTTPGNSCIPVTGGTLGSDVTVQQNSESVFAIDGLSGSTDSMSFTWLATNGAVLVLGGGAHDFAARYRFPNVGESVVTCQVTNCGGSVTRSVKATVPSPPEDNSLQPYFDYAEYEPYWLNGVLQQAKVVLFNLKNATRYKIFEGPVTDNNPATAPEIPPGGGFFLPAPPAGVSKKYTVRVWNGTDANKWADRSITVTSPVAEAVQQIRRIQTRRSPNVVNKKGIELRVETIGGYVPRFAFSKSGGFPTITNNTGQVPAFVQGTYQYGTIISDLPNTGAEFISVGFANSAGQVIHIAIDDKSVTDADWVTQYDSTLNA